MYDPRFEEYEKRVVVIAKKEKPMEIIVGVHAKTDKNYWNQLIKLFENIKKNYSERKIIITGDLNVFIPGTE